MSNSNQRPDNHMVWAILSTIFCCLPLGIVSIINAAKVDGLWRSGEYEAAEEAASNAKKYATWAAWIGGILLVLSIIFEVGFLAAADKDNSSSDAVALLDDESELTADDIRTALTEGLSEADDECPYEAGNGMSITSIKMSGNYAVYTVECDEDFVSIASLKVSKSSVKETLIEELTSGNDDDVKSLIDNLKAIGGGIIYKYVGDTSGDVCNIKIEAEELDI